MTLKTYFSVIFAVIMALLFGVIISFSVMNSKAFLKTQLAEQSQLIGVNIARDLIAGKHQSEPALVAHFSDYQNVYQFEYLHLVKEGITLSQYRKEKKENAVSWLESLLSIDNPLFQKSFDFNQSQYTLQLQVSAKSASAYLFQSLKDVCLIFAFFITFGWFIFRLAINVIKAPIDALKTHTNQIANKEFIKAPEINSVSEMNALMSSHNRMTNQVKEIVNELTTRLEHAKGALYRDELTQLGNRRLFSAQFSQLLHDEKEQTGALMLLRLSEWETVRRKEGFLVARSFLEDVIYILQSTSKQGANTRIYRLNDNEFACVLQHITRDELATILNQMSSDLTCLQGRYQQKKVVLVGAVMWQSSEAMSDVLKSADEAVLQATKERHSYHLYEPSRHIKEVSELLSSPEKIMLAIQESNLTLSQHGVMMTDQVSLMFSEVLSKVQYQGEVIPTLLLQSKAEQFAASSHLDKRIFNQVRALYLKGKLDLPVSINISVYSVLDDEFYAWLIEQSGQFSDLFKSIIWEFDEQMLAAIQVAPQVISKLHKLGSKVAIDHFGTGDNTLIALRKWPIDIIKLDGSYIHELEHKQDSWYFLENIIKLAHSLGIVVVCEQLESDAQVNWAKELGSDGLQGFKLAMPHSVD